MGNGFPTPFLASTVPLNPKKSSPPCLFLASSEKLKSCLVKVPFEADEGEGEEGVEVGLDEDENGSEHRWISSSRVHPTDSVYSSAVNG